MPRETVEVNTDAQVTTPVAGTVGFGVGQLNNPTPMWATWTFRVVLVLTTAATIWLASTNLIKPESKVEIILALKVLDMVVWGIGRFLGVSREDIEKQII